jgi:hypothetical protein
MDVMFRVTVIVERLHGKFASREDVGDQIREALDDVKRRRLRGPIHPGRR